MGEDSTTVAEKDRSFFDQAYFLGTDTSKRGEFSLTEVTGKYEDRAMFPIDRLTAVERTLGVKVLDVGGGAAAFERAVENLANKSELPTIDVVTTDISAVGMNLVKKEGDEHKFAQADIYRLPMADGSFDGVTAWDILEHLNDPKAALDEISRVTKPGGFIHIVCPNPEAFTVGTPKDTYRRDKSHVWPPVIGVDYFKEQLEQIGYNAEVYTRGFADTGEYLKKMGKDLVKRAEDDRTGTHIVVYARKKLQS